MTATAVLWIACLQFGAPRAVIEGYTGDLSYRAGDRIEFCVSCSTGSFDLEIARIGGSVETVFRRKGIAAAERPIPADASANGCGWPAAFSLEAPASWRSGYYLATMRAIDQDNREHKASAFFVIRSTPGKPANGEPPARILLQLSTNTYNAYCNWGGYSLYAYNGKDKVQGRRVSFNRPVTSQFDLWERHFVEWAERAGYRLDFAVNSDLEFHPELLDRCRLVLSVGHDEYWSTPMRDHLEAFIRRGGNVAFFSGNTCCWQVRSEEHGRALVCWKQSFGDDPIYRTADRRLLSTLWSHHLVGRPENQLTGVGFLFGGYRKSHGQFMDDKAEYTVHRPEHWILEGTKLKRGDVFGGKDTIVGYECDGCEFVVKDGLPVPTGRDGTPADFQILASCPARWHPDDCEWYERWEKGRIGACVLGTYSSNGTVVTVGSTDWSHGLRGKDPVVERVTRNILDRLAR